MFSLFFGENFMSSDPRSTSDDQGFDQDISEIFTSLDPLNDDISPPNNLNGEFVSIRIYDSILQVSPGSFISVALVISNYSIRICPSKSKLSFLGVRNPSVSSWLHIPLSCIDKIEREKVSKSKAIHHIVKLSCKDLRTIRLIFYFRTTLIDGFRNKAPLSMDGIVDEVVTYLSVHVFPNSINKLFAFSHKFPNPPDAITRYDVKTELIRLGIISTYREYRETSISVIGASSIPSSLFRISGVNAAYHMCTSYPQVTNLFYIYTPPYKCMPISNISTLLLSRCLWSRKV